MHPTSRPSALRIGVTMREMLAQGYDEPRDALARNWAHFLHAALPDAAWLPVPNLGAPAVLRLCKTWALNAFILTGGEDIGECAIRDETERALLRHAIANDFPVFGVCRGLQLMWSECGGKLYRDEAHIAARHALKMSGERQLQLDGAECNVNSFHANCLSEPQEESGHHVFARAADGSAEGVMFAQGMRAGVMWHPEREAVASPHDIVLIRSLFARESTK